MLFFNNFPQNVSSFLAEAPIFQHKFNAIWEFLYSHTDGL